MLAGFERIAALVRAGWGASFGALVVGILAALPLSLAAMVALVLLTPVPLGAAVALVAVVQFIACFAIAGRQVEKERNL